MSATMSKLIELLECKSTNTNGLIMLYDLKRDTAYQSCKRTVRSSRYIVFDKKSIPIVAWNLDDQEVCQESSSRKWEKENANVETKII